MVALRRAALVLQPMPRAMGKKKKKRAKSAKKRKRTMLPPSVDAGASTQQSTASLAAMAAEAAAHDPLAPLELTSASVPTELRPTQPEIEHRATPRTSLVVELHLASDSHFFSGLSGDISEGGVFVSTYRDLATGTPVDLEFSLPGSERVMK